MNMCVMRGWGNKRGEENGGWRVEALGINGMGSENKGGRGGWLAGGASANELHSGYDVNFHSGRV